MLEVKCQEYFERVVAFAEKKGLKKYLEEKLDYLRKFSDHEEKGLCIVELRRDCAPASFGIFWFLKDPDDAPYAPQRPGYKLWMNGALVYHGDQTGWDEKGTYVDPLTTRIGNDDNPWGVHS